MHQDGQASRHAEQARGTHEPEAGQESAVCPWGGKAHCHWGLWWLELRAPVEGSLLLCGHWKDHI